MENINDLLIPGQQIPSPKSKQNSKHTPQQSSPTAQRKYNFYQGVGNQQSVSFFLFCKRKTPIFKLAVRLFADATAIPRTHTASDQFSTAKHELNAAKQWVK